MSSHGSGTQIRSSWITCPMWLTVPWSLYSHLRLSSCKSRHFSNMLVETSGRPVIAKREISAASLRYHLMACLVFWLVATLAVCSVSIFWDISPGSQVVRIKLRQIGRDTLKELKGSPREIVIRLWTCHVPTSPRSRKLWLWLHLKTPFWDRHQDIFFILGVQASPSAVLWEVPPSVHDRRGWA